jgi:hypothetical protein
MRYVYFTLGITVIYVYGDASIPDRQYQLGVIERESQIMTIHK